MASAREDHILCREGTERILFQYCLNLELNTRVKQEHRRAAR